MLREMIKRSVFNWKMVVACGLGIALLYHEMIFGWVNLRGVFLNRITIMDWKSFLRCLRCLLISSMPGYFRGFPIAFPFWKNGKVDICR